MTTIIDLIRRYVVAQNTTQYKLAQQLGMSQSEMSHLMHGRKFASIQQRISMMELGVASAEELLRAELAYKETISPLARAAKAATTALATSLREAPAAAKTTVEKWRREGDSNPR